MCFFGQTVSSNDEWFQKFLKTSSRGDSLGKHTFLRAVSDLRDTAKVLRVLLWKNLLYLRAD